MAKLQLKTRQRLAIALTDPGAAKDLVAIVEASSSGSLVGTAPAASTAPVVTYTAGSAPYTADGTITVANGASVTALEAYSLALEALRQVAAIQTKLTARGVTL